MSSPKKKWTNSPFTEKQEFWTILEYGALRNFIQVTKKLRTPFKLSPYQVPCINFGNRFIIENPKTKHAALKGIW